MTQPEGTPEGGAPCWGAGFLPAHHQGTLFRSGPAPIVNLKPPGRVLARQQRDARLPHGDERAGPRPGRHRALGPDRHATSWPSACRAPRPRRSTSRASRTETQVAVRPRRPADRRVRHALPARPAAGRARRAVRPALFGRRPGRDAVGRPRRHRRQPREDVRHDRQAGRRAAHRPQADAACSTRRWSSGAASSAGRPSARAAAAAATTTPPASRCGWPAAASRAARSSAPPTRSASRRSPSRAHVNDIHATILHLMGLDHKQLTFLHNGRDERLTDVAAGC